MSENEKNSENKSDKKSESKPALEQDEKKRLLRRVGLAAVMIAALIVALALFERQQQPTTPEIKLSPVPSISPPAAETPQAGTSQQAAGSIAPLSTEAEVKPEPRAEPERSALPEQRGSAASPKIPLAPKEESPPRLVVGQGTEAASKAAPSAPATPAAASPSPAKAAVVLHDGYLVQVGVFSNLANAEEMRQKLGDAGIAARIEAHVQVGPFASRAEAAGVQQKLRALGMDAGILLPSKK